MVNALQHSYPSYVQQNQQDQMKEVVERTSFNRTLESLHFDPSKEEDLTVNKLIDLQYTDIPHEEDEIINSYHSQVPSGDLKYNFPKNKAWINLFYYNPHVDLSDYKSEFSQQNLISPKKDRFEVFKNSMELQARSYFDIIYSNPKHQNLNIWLVPEVDEKDETISARIRKRTNRERYIRSIDTTSAQTKINEFLDKQIDKDTAQITDEEIDQALFESTYIKPVQDSESFKSKT